MEKTSRVKINGGRVIRLSIYSDYSVSLDTLSHIKQVEVILWKADVNGK